MLVNQRVEVKKNGAQPIKTYQAPHSHHIIGKPHTPSWWWWTAVDLQRKKNRWRPGDYAEKSLPRPSWKYHSWHLFGGFYNGLLKGKKNGSFLLPNLLGFDWLKSRMKSPFWGMSLATIGDPGLNDCTTISNRMLRRCTVFGTIQNPQPSWRHKISKSMSKEIIQLRSVEWLKLHSPAGSRILGGTLSQGSGDWKDQNLGQCAANALLIWNGISWKDHEKHCRLIICISCFFS